MTSEPVTHAVAYDEMGHDTPPDARVEQHLQPLLDWLQSDLMELASLLSHTDKKWFIAVTAEIFDAELKFDDDP